MMFAPAPYFLKDVSVSQVMTQVCIALVPGIAAYAWLVGPAVLVQLVIASAAALAAESLMLRLRGKPQAMFLSDGSAVVTAWLIALTFPPLAPWWLVALGTVFAIVVAKHLYGGLGQNPFNPAMVAFAVCIVSFPALMSQWPPATLHTSFADQLAIVFGQLPRLDAITGATPLDALKTALKLSEGQATVTQITADTAIFGRIAGHGWEWVSLGYLLGGLWLWQRKIISWHLPLSFIAGIALISGALWLSDPGQFADPLFHLFSGGSMLGAFFIATDPVTASATPRGRLIYGAGIGVLVYIIRAFGGYPDGVAFSVLLMNIAAPTIDLYTQPRVFGARRG